MEVVTKYYFSYILLPGPRNQDIVQITPHTAGVVDGWSDEALGNDSGRKIAKFVLTNYPKEFLAQKGVLIDRAQKAAEVIDRLVIKKFSDHIACVGVFLFIGKKIDIVSFGTIDTFLWDGQKWLKPKEIADDSLPMPQYPSDTRDFFGGGNWKSDPFYAIKADSLSVPLTTSILIATDGLDDVMRPEEIPGPSKNLLPFLKKEISRRGTQKDDITLLLRF